MYSFITILCSLIRKYLWLVTDPDRLQVLAKLTSTRLVWPASQRGSSKFRITSMPFWPRVLGSQIAGLIRVLLIEVSRVQRCTWYSNSLLELQFIQKEDLVLEDCVVLNQYRDSLDYIRTWDIRGPYNHTCNAKKLWKLAYDWFWEIKRRSSVDNAPNSIMIVHDLSAIFVSLWYVSCFIEYYNGKMCWSSKANEHLWLVIPHHLQVPASCCQHTNQEHEETFNVPKKQPWSVMAQYCNPNTLCACEAQLWPIRCGDIFFEWKRGVWTPGGSPLQPPLGRGSNEGKQSVYGPIRHLLACESNQWHLYVGQCTVPAIIQSQSSRSRMASQWSNWHKL